MKRMKAAVLIEPGKLELKEAKNPECPNGGVLIQIIACGICAADVKMTEKGHPALVLPRIPGHEIAGVVAESRTDEFRAGERLQVAPGLRCGSCFQCKRGHDNQCEKREIIGFTRDGGFAEYIAVPLQGEIVGAVNRLPDHVSFGAATLAEPIACCINAQERTDVGRDDSVLITGAGPLGLLNLFIAKDRGAGKVIISEPDHTRAKMASDFNVDAVLDPTGDNFYQAVMDETGGRGVDVIVFASSLACFDEPYHQLLAPGGRVSIFSGIAPLDSNPKIDLSRIHYNETSITGAYGCTAKQNRQAVDMLSSGRLPVQEIITMHVKLENVLDGFEYSRMKEGIKAIAEVKHE